MVGNDPFMVMAVGAGLTGQVSLVNKKLACFQYWPDIDASR
jgi:hypothetical protein